MYQRQSDGFYYRVQDGMCVGRPLTENEVPVFQVTYSFTNMDGERVTTTQQESRDGLATITALIAAKDRMAYRIHNIEAL